MIGKKNLFNIELKAKNMYDTYLANNLPNVKGETLEKRKVKLDANILECEYKMEQYMNEWKTSAATIHGTPDEKKEYIRIILTKYYLEEKKLKEFHLEQISVCGSIAEAKALEAVKAQKDINEEYAQILVREAKLKAESNAMERMHRDPIDKYLNVKLELIYIHSQRVLFETKQNDSRMQGPYLEMRLALKQAEIAEIKDRMSAYSRELDYSRSIVNRRFEKVGMDQNSNVNKNRSYYVAYCKEIENRYVEDAEQLEKLKLEEIDWLVDVAVTKASADTTRYKNEEIPEEYLKQYKRLDLKHFQLKSLCSLLEKLEKLPVEKYFPKKLEKIIAEGSFERLRFIINSMNDNVSDLEAKVIEIEADIYALKKRKAAYEAEINYAHAYRCSSSEKCQFLQQVAGLLKKEDLNYLKLVEDLEEATIKCNCGNDYDVIQQKVYEGLK